jgi:hypothetical protein
MENPMIDQRTTERSGEAAAEIDPYPPGLERLAELRRPVQALCKELWLQHRALASRAETGDAAARQELADFDGRLVWFQHELIATLQLELQGWQRQARAAAASDPDLQARQEVERFLNLTTLGQRVLAERGR